MPETKENAATVELSGVAAETVSRQMADAEALTSFPPSKSLLAHLREWLSTVADDHPYNDLPRLARDAGWDWMLRQGAVMPTDTTIVVTFQVLIGRVGMDAVRFEYVDEATFALPAAPGPVSVAARAQINPTIVYMLFGRLPPSVARQPAAPAEETVVDMGDDDVQLDSRGDAVPVDDIDPPITGADVKPWVPGEGLPDVVARWNSDGVPVFLDLDDVQAPSQDVIVAVTNEVNSALVKMTSVDQVLDMWNRNAPAFEWLTDMATPEQRSAITGAFGRRKGQIEAGYTDVAPRRRAVN